MIVNFLYDALFSAIAAIGFSAISNPSKKAYLFCALIAAIGHSVRYLFLNQNLIEINIIPSTATASFIIGILAVLLSPLVKIPAETFLYPSLLPMIPGIYAYKAFGGLAMCIFHSKEVAFLHYFYLFMNNALVCLFIIIGMVVGGTLPVFLLKGIAYRTTR